MDGTVRRVVYTAIVGPIGDQLYPVYGWPPDVPLVAFVDRPAPPPPPWRLRQAQRDDLEPRRRARWHKIHAHVLFPGVHETIWVDGSLTPSPALLEQTEGWPGSMVVHRHPWRSCAYEEGEYCARRRIDDPETIMEQLQRYANDGFPRGWGLAETGCLLRRGDWSQWNAAWWQEIERGSVRDQISWPFVCWRMGVIPYYVEANLRRVPWLKWRRHGTHRHPGAAGA